MDRTSESGKSKRGRVYVMVNSSWCESMIIVPVTHSCTPKVELLTIKCCPFCLPLKFTLIIVSAIYIPPQANMDTALCELRGALTILQAYHLEAVLIVVWNFNRANLKRTVSNLYQHITCATRAERTLDHCYTHSKTATKHRLNHRLEKTANFPMP